MSSFKMIAAMGQNRELGVKGKIPWNIPEDMKHFKEKTNRGNVIFGRKTWEGMSSRWLSNRNLWIMTRKNTYGWLQTTTNNPRFRCTVNMVEDAAHLPDENYWVAGGAEVYSLFLEKVTEAYITLVKGKFPEADAFMPAFEEKFGKNEVLTSNEFFDIVHYTK